MVEVLVEGRRIDVFEGFDFSFNYSIADVREPDKRNTEYSKTIQCPSTPNNDEIFGHIYDVNISNPFDVNSANIGVNFNPNKKAEARVVADGIEVMSGVLQMRKITSRGTDYRYDVVFIGKLVNIFSELSDKKINGVGDDGLRFLDFSDLNHAFNKPNVIASWSNTSGYIYPMVDYGSTVQYILGLRSWTVNDFRPALFAKTILDRIFEYAGFTYTSTFFSSAFFARLIVPFAGEKVFGDQTVTNTYKFQASAISADGPYIAAQFPFVNGETRSRPIGLGNDSTNGNFDNGNHFSTFASSYIVPSSGYYSFFLNESVKISRTTYNSARNYQGYVKAGAAIVLQRNGVQSIISESFSQFTELPQNQSTYIDTVTVNTSVNEFTFFAGDIVTFRWAIDTTDLFSSNISGTQISNTNFFDDCDITIESATAYNEPSNQIFEGDTMFINETAPDMGMAEFVMNLVKMFNLYIIPDPLNETNLLIETRNDFYAAGSIKDWTHKLDRKRPIEVQPLAMLTSRKYEYTYSEDKDYYNELYQSTRGHVYGRRLIDVENDFLKNTNTIEVTFAASPLVNDGGSNRIITKIYSSSIEDGAKPTDCKTRILYYSLLPSDPDWIFTSYFSGTTYEQSYPYAGHLTHPITPSQDINFGIPLELYYSANAHTGTISYTNANLFNVFHKKHIEEITNKDSKVLTGYFNLTPLDIFNLDFRDQILIDNSYWRINKVSDYNPFKVGLTMVELLKVRDAVTFTGETFTIGTSGTVTSSGVSREKKPILPRKQLLNSNQYPPFNGTVKGLNNRVADTANTFTVIGNNNTIAEGSYNITIIGSDNYVGAGLHDVTIINTNGVTVSKSGTSYVDNKEQWSAKILDGGLNTVRPLDSGGNIFTVDGGLNKVSEQFSEYAISLIDGNAG